ncbi:unnamed protein product [Symbiodinium natans]|uniref:Uncharacterized protein n=1 Tax=Symbiodinium natans TaxID=878477 RepID=A0A812QK95_9DINO|nr:unnamed protein product [Symbiodinium natans]
MANLRSPRAPLLYGDIPPSSIELPGFGERLPSLNSIPVRGPDGRLIRFQASSPPPPSIRDAALVPTVDQYQPATSHVSDVRVRTMRFGSGGLVPSRRPDDDEWDFERAAWYIMKAPVLAVADTCYSLAIKPVVGTVRIFVVLLGDVVGIFELYLVMPIGRGLGCCGPRRRHPDEEEGLIHATGHRVLVKPIVGASTVLTDWIWDVARVTGEYVLTPSALLVSGVSIGVGGGLMAFGQTLQRVATIPPSQTRYF